MDFSTKQMQTERARSAIFSGLEFPEGLVVTGNERLSQRPYTGYVWQLEYVCMWRERNAMTFCNEHQDVISVQHEFVESYRGKLSSFYNARIQGTVGMSEINGGHPCILLPLDLESFKGLVHESKC
ncbi:unnamed protein product [Ilex paraguariensis]|uniref:Uncharacterized protein n=1 Tax=Ilex paraguariensis TaxID=185542 RepID=A0ABC8QTD6_9AQUA